MERINENGRVTKEFKKIKYCDMVDNIGKLDYY